jgi:hypothetical protein
MESQHPLFEASEALNATLSNKTSFLSQPCQSCHPYIGIVVWFFFSITIFPLVVFACGSEVEKREGAKEELWELYKVDKKERDAWLGPRFEILEFADRKKREKKEKRDRKERETVARYEMLEKEEGGGCVIDRLLEEGAGKAE